MIINKTQIKSYLSVLYLIVVCCIHISAQDTAIVNNYLQQAGIYAEIYNGKMEVVYAPSSLYEDLPYFKNADFTEASIIYRGNYFPNQKARLDLSLEQLVILTPEKQYRIILNPQYVGKVYMHDKTVVYLTPPKETGLKTGYYIQLQEGKKIQLFCKEYYTPQQRIQGEKALNYFNHGIRYYLLYNNRYYTVKNKNSFSKVFPQYKKQINSFVRGNRLNFNQDKDESLTSLARYCEELVTSMNKQ
ncbi:MAG: hypothetical protein FWD60_02580 [Candidatus Azobacteroides sp.]|nr:hypothetical protein [Candidatus Azobacteroides sp.]